MKSWVCRPACVHTVMFNPPRAGKGVRRQGKAIVLCSFVCTLAWGFPDVRGAGLPKG